MSFTNVLMMAILAQETPPPVDEPAPSCPPGWSNTAGEKCAPVLKDLTLKPPPPSAPVTVRYDSVVILGTLSKREVTQLIKTTASPVEACYLQRLAEKPDIAGKLKLRIELSADGSVKSVTTKSWQAADEQSTIVDPVIEECAQEAVRALQFPRIGSGGIAILTYEWQLQPPTAPEAPKAPAP